MTDIDPLIRGFFHAQDALTAAASNNAGTIIWQIVLQIVLIALNAVFACAEIAVLSVYQAAVLDDNQVLHLNVKHFELSLTCGNHTLENSHALTLIQRTLNT